MPLSQKIIRRRLLGVMPTDRSTADSRRRRAMPLDTVLAMLAAHTRATRAVKPYSATRTRATAEEMLASSAVWSVTA